MSNRFSYIKDFSVLSEDHHKGIYQFALAEAQKNDCGVRVCMYSKSHCDQILERIFSTPNINKLLKNKPYSENGIEVSLETLKTLSKKRFSRDNWVYLLLFPSPDLLDLVEKINGSVAIIAFSESQDSEHLVSWQEHYDVVQLTDENA